MAELSFRLILQTDDATGKLAGIKQEADGLKSALEKPHQVKIDAAASLASIRDVTIAVQGVMQAMSSLTRGINGFLDAELTQRRALTLATQAFGEAAGEMAAFASSMQEITNFGDEEMLSMFAKMSQTFKLSTDEIKALTPGLLDFTEATAATGMTMESAFDLMGRALNGHTEMLGRHGIELDKDRLAMEGVSYLVEKLAEDYGGTATALADLRTQNANAWGDIQETIGAMLNQIVNPLIKGLKSLMDAYNGLSPVMKGFVTGITVAIPLVVTVTTTIVALTAAVAALKTAINPVAGSIGLIIGALTAAGFAIAASTLETEEAAAATQTLTTSLNDCGTAVQTESAKFGLLASRLLDLRSKTSMTNDEKQTMKTLIDEINSNYGEYLGNINLETAAYDDLTAAINRTSSAIIAKAVADNYGRLYSQQVDAIAKLTVAAHDRFGQDYANQMLADPFKKFTVTVKTGFETMGIAETTYYEHYPQIKQIVEAKKELLDIELKMRNALKDVPDFNLGGGGGGGGGGAGSPARTAATVDAELAEFERMIKSLQAASQDAFQRHDAEYARRLELINKYTESESNERKQALIMLHEWDTAETQKIFADERAAMQKAFEDKIAYYANLNELGVNSYDQLKAATEEYYAWAQANLPEQERELVLAQLRQTNLRWGQHRQEQIDKEVAHQEELADIRDEFAGRGLELDNNTYALQLRALDNYYKKSKQKLIEAGLTEEEITAQHQKAILKLNLDAAGQVLGGVSSILGDLASAMDQENATQFKIWKGLAIAQAIVDTLAGANAAYKAMATIPVAGPGLAVAAAAAALAAGYLNVKKISATEYKPTAATGGYLIGAPHAAGGTVIEAEGGEYIIRKDRVATFGKSFFDFVNSASLANVRAAFAGFSLPHLPMPAYAGSFAASGGYVSGSNPNSALIDEIRALRDAILGARPTINVSVDPLSSDPVKISEIAERGSRIRSRF